MPQPKDMGPDVKTEEERLAHRRFEAYFAFESEWQPKNLSPEQFHPSRLRRVEGDE